MIRQKIARFAFVAARHPFGGFPSRQDALTAVQSFGATIAAGLFGKTMKDARVVRSLGLSHIVREADGTAVGHWGPYALRTAFQPIFTFHASKLRASSFEGLIRPFREGKACSPGNFFTSIPSIDRLHVEALARDLHILNAGQSFGRTAALFINFDPSLFCEKPVVDAALREMRIVLAEAALAAGDIVCEVTEQSSASKAALRDFVDALRGEGYRIAVDDYGSDSSDIERVKALKPDIVKFDARWVARLMDSRPGVALLKVMVSEFTQRGIVTVFEGIEENWQLDVAAEVGAAMVQGFVLARPELAPIRFSPDPAPDAAPNRAAGPARDGLARPAYDAELGAGEPADTPVRKTPSRIFGRRGAR